MEKLVIIDGKDVFKYPVIGKMTSANVAGACKAAGMKPTCYDDSVPEYQDSNCVQLSGNIFIEIQKILCPDPDWILLIRANHYRMYLST